VLQSLAHAHGIVHRIAETPIKLDDAVVGSPNLQIDLRAACGPEQPLRLRDDGSRPAAPQTFSIEQLGHGGGERSDRAKAPGASFPARSVHLR